MKIYGVVLAGGLSRRMGTDKALLPLGHGHGTSPTLLDNACAKLRSQVSDVLINSNGSGFADSYRGFSVMADVIPGGLGPLAGILTGLEWAVQQGGTDGWLVSVPVDSPFFPDDLADRFLAVRDGNGCRAVIGASGGRVHPVFGLWSVGLAQGLRQDIIQGRRRVMDWVMSIPAAVVDWPIGSQDPFYNVNTPQDLNLVSGDKLP